MHKITPNPPPLHTLHDAAERALNHYLGPASRPTESPAKLWVRNRCAAKLNDNWALIDTLGNSLTPFAYESMTTLPYGRFMGKINDGYCLWRDTIRCSAQYAEAVDFGKPYTLVQQAGWGRIINIASTAGQVGYAYVAAYSAAKHGVIGLTKSVALETSKKGITVNAVCPGYTETEIVRESIARIVEKTGRTIEQAKAQLTAANPQGRLIQTNEVANAVVWLCSEGASAISGQSISVCGGEVM